MVNINVTEIDIMGAPLEGVNPLPYFRDKKHHSEISYIEPFPENKKDKFGYGAGYRILPYCMQDRYSRNRQPMKFKLIVMENRYLRAGFLPELGGRLVSLIDKETERELLSRNPVFQPANLAIRNAWFSGGIEWNIGQFGHSFHTCSPVFFAAVNGKNGEKFLRMYEFERCKCLFWYIDFYLPEDSKLLFSHVCVINPNNENTSAYWWTNIAVPETPEARIFSSAEEVIYNDPGIESGKKGFGYGRMPRLPSLPGEDMSYPFRSPFSNEYFFQTAEGEMPWEAVAYKNGEMFFEVSTEKLKYRKMFCWGHHDGGRHWQDYLAEPGTAYLEIQAGLAPTQLHGIEMPANGIWAWTQAFGGTYVNPVNAHQSDWSRARLDVEQQVNRMIDAQKIAAYEAAFNTNAECIPYEILHSGSGWGALEILRRLSYENKFIIPGIQFPSYTLSEEQYPWISLLKNGRLDEKEPGQIPGAWLIQPEWRELLLSSLGNKHNRNWYALLHAGVMAYEDGDEEEAENFWKESISKRESIWAFRNLAILERRKGRLDASIAYMKKVMELPEAYVDPSLAEEYLSLLKETGEYSLGWDVFQSLPPAIQRNERIRLITGCLAIELGKNDFLEELFTHEFACIREGELVLTDLWFKYKARKIASECGREVNTELMDDVINHFDPPSRLDFRMVRTKK